MKKTAILALLITLALLAGILLMGVKDNENVPPSDNISKNAIHDTIAQLQDNNLVTARLTGPNSDLTLEVAKSSQKRAEGLMFRETMGKDNGMFFIFESEQQLTFWMKNTLLSLDIIYINSDLEIVAVHKNTKINQTTELYPSNEPSVYVIEIGAGWVDDHSIKVGDSLIELKLLTE